MSERHVHACPTCYEYVPCGDRCDARVMALGDGTPVSNPLVCEACMQKEPRNPWPWGRLENLGKAVHAEHLRGALERQAKSR